MDKKGSKFRTDQPGVVPVDILNDASLRRIQAKMEMRYPVSIDEIKKSAQVEKLVRKETSVLKFASLALIPKDFEPLGTGFYRKGHSLWSLQKEGDSFILVRAQEEKFEDEEEIGETLEEILEEENDNGNGENGDDEEDEDGKEKESQGPGQPPSTIFNPPSLPMDNMASRQADRRTAVDSTARDYYTSYYGGDVAKDYGKALTENKHDLISPLVAKAYFKMMGRTMPPPLKKARPNWNKLANKYGSDMASDVRAWLGEGLVQVHIASHLKCRPEIAHVWRPVIDKIGMNKTKALRNDLIRKIAVAKLTASHTTKTVRTAQKALDIEIKHLTKKIAVDEAAKTYYEKYFGNYGKELTKNVNELLVTAPKAD